MTKRRPDTLADHAHLDDLRRLDVALLILLGVKKIHYQEWDGERMHPYYIPSGKPWRTHQIDAEPVPQFTEHWIAMGQLLAVLAVRHIYLIRLTNGSLSDDKTPYACWLGRSADDAPWTAIADDAPRAVAEAAYQALAGKVWGQDEKPARPPLHICVCGHWLHLHNKICSTCGCAEYRQAPL